MKKILLAIKTSINFLSFIYDCFFKKFNGSSLDLEYENKIKEIQRHSQSFSEWEVNLELIRNDILNKGFKYFLRHQTILHTMFVSNRIYVLKELFFVLNYLRINKRTNINMINESPVGKPIRYLFYPFSSGNLIHHSYSLFLYLNKSNKWINDFDFIFEYGGGYGGFARLCRNIGYKGNYILYDLEEMTIIQEYYLKSLNKFHNTKKYYDNRINIISDLSNTPNISNSKTLFVALWSLSESPLEIRKRIEEILQVSDSILIAFQPRFSSVDNIEYFNSLSFDPPVKVIEMSYFGYKQFYLMR